MPPCPARTAGLLGLVLAGCAGASSDDDDTGAAPSDDTNSPVALPEVPYVPLRRLSAPQLERTLHALLDVDVPLVATFPEEVPGFGFDDNTATQTISDLWVEKARDAAHTAVRSALALDGPRTARIEVEDLGLATGDLYELPEAPGGLTWLVVDDTPVADTLFTDDPGTYAVRVRALWANGWQEVGASGDPPVVAVSVDGQERDRFDVTAVGLEPEVLDTTAFLDVGSHRVEVVLTNPRRIEGRGDLAVALDWIELAGPLSAEGEVRVPSREALLPCDGADVAACARKVLAPFLAEAWRRPITEAEAARYVALVVETHERVPFDEALAVGLEAALLSPHFLLRLEPDDGTDGVRLLAPHELATRLSYLLWGRHPDDALRACADEGALGTGSGPCSLSAQVDRMIDDPRASWLRDGFFHPWLGTRNLAKLDADPSRYPALAGLEDDMMAETNALLDHLIASDVSVQDLVSRDVTTVSPALADHYGLDARRRDGRASLEGTGRAGILGQGAWLAAWSHPTRTSPTRRGAFVVEQLLCEEVGQPPPNVPELDEEVAQADGVRGQLETHAANPACAQCHETIDPVGLALEHLDVDGTWRDHYDDGPVDASAELPDGTRLDGAVALAQALRGPELARCIAQQLHTYAVARGPVDADAERLDAWVAEGKVDAGLRTLLAALVTDPVFTHRRGAPE